jgi:hypothetical protein
VGKLLNTERRAIIASVTIEELQIAGAILYACEGTKARKDTRGKNRFNYSIELNSVLNSVNSCFSQEEQGNTDKPYAN